MISEWRLRSKTLDVSEGAVVGVLNVTTDSFSDGGLYMDKADAVAAGLAMFEQGADAVDVGGESTRPGSDPVTADVEIQRVLPVISELAGAGVTVSVDTSKPQVARLAIEAGAEIINDVTAASARGMGEVMAETGAGVILMHMKGTPRTMQIHPVYDDVVAEVSAFLAKRGELLAEQGVARGCIAIDPGIGFGKTATHNLELIHRLQDLSDLGFPVVFGASRKSFLGTLTGIGDPRSRDGVTAVTTALAFERGARIFRVHDVASSRAALRVAAAIVNSQEWDEWSLD